MQIHMTLYNCVRADLHVLKLHSLFQTTCWPTVLVYIHISMQMYFQVTGLVSMFDVTELLPYTCYTLRILVICIVYSLAIHYTISNLIVFSIAQEHVKRVACCVNWEIFFQIGHRSVTWSTENPNKQFWAGTWSGRRNSCNVSCHHDSDGTGHHSVRHHGQVMCFKWTSCCMRSGHA